MESRFVTRKLLGWLVVLAAVPCAALAQTSPQVADISALAERVQLLEDREDIRALILAYGIAHDTRDYRAFAALFAEEGEWVGGLGSAKGSAAIFELMDGTIGHDAKPEGSGTYHLLTNEQIAIDGDRAAATTKWIYVTPGEDRAPQMVFLGHYNDEFIRAAGSWKFLRREAPVAIPAEE